MNRTDKNRQLRHQIKEERDNLYETEFVYGEAIEYSFKVVNDKLDDISDKLENLSKRLYEYAKSDNGEYSKMFDDMMGNPMEQLDKLFEVKK